MVNYIEKLSRAMFKTPDPDDKVWIRRLFSDLVDEEIFSVVEVNKLDQVDVTNTYWVQAWKFGVWDHPKYGKEVVDQQFAEELVANFRANVYGQELPFDYEHGLDPAKGLQAAGWIRDMAVRDDGVYYLLEFTEDAASEIKAGKWKYVSPAYLGKWKNDSTGETFSNVPTGGGITNRPYFKGMLPLNFSEITIDKSEWAEDWKREYTAIMVAIDKERKEASMDLELLRKFAEVLGITLPKEFTEDDAMAEFKKLNDVVQPLREAQERANNTKTFAEQFPEEYKRMVALEASQLDTNAKEFAASYERFTIKKDDKDEKDTRGFSSLVIGKIEETHKKFSEGTVTSEDLKDVLDHIASGGIVDYKEYGSSRRQEQTGVDLNDNQGVKKAFTELVEEIMTEDGMDYSKAVRLAAQKDPQLFSSYMTAPKA